MVIQSTWTVDEDGTVRRGAHAPRSAPGYGGGRPRGSFDPESRSGRGAILVMRDGLSYADASAIVGVGEQSVRHAVTRRRRIDEC